MTEPADDPPEPESGEFSPKSLRDLFDAAWAEPYRPEVPFLITSPEHFPRLEAALRRLHGLPPKKDR